MCLLSIYLCISTLLLCDIYSDALSEENIQLQNEIHTLQSQLDQLQSHPESFTPGPMGEHPVISNLTTPLRVSQFNNSSTVPSLKNTPKSASHGGLTVRVQHGDQIIPEDGMEGEASVGVLQPMQLPLTPLHGAPMFTATNPIRTTSSPRGALLEEDVEGSASLEILHEKDVLLSQCYQSIDMLQSQLQEKEQEIQSLHNMLHSHKEQNDEQLTSINNQTNHLYEEYTREVTELRRISTQRVSLFVVAHVDNNRRQVERLQLQYCFAHWNIEVLLVKLNNMKSQLIYSQQQLQQHVTNNTANNTDTANTANNISSPHHAVIPHMVDTLQDNVNSNSNNTIDADLIHYLPTHDNTTN